MSNDGEKIHDANMRQALRSHHGRTGYVPIVEYMPWDQLLEVEGDRGNDANTEEDDEREDRMAERRAAIRGFYRYLLAEGDHPLKIMKRLYAVGNGMRIEPFCTMTMEERGLMFGEGKAAVSWRMKKLSGEVEKSGQLGSRMPGQKTKGSTSKYSAAQIGNNNRAKGIRKKLKNL